MNPDLVIDELADYALQKHAADDDEFSSDPVVQKQKDRSQKLKLALIGLGALGAGGAAAWALSGDAAKSVGQWIGGGAPKPPSFGETAFNPLVHGAAVGGYMAAQRSGVAGKYLGDIEPSGAIRGAHLRVEKDSLPQRVLNTAADAGLAPRNSPDRVASDLKRLSAPAGKDGAPAKEPGWHMYPASDAAKIPYGQVADYMKTGPIKNEPPKAPGANATPDEKQKFQQGQLDWKTDQPVLKALSAAADPLKLQAAFAQFTRSNGPAAMHASSSGLYVRQGDKYLPLSAVDMPIDQILRSQEVVQHYVDKDGKIQTEKVNLAADPASGSKLPLPLRDQMYHLGATTRVGSVMTPTEEVNLFLLKQQTAPKLLERLKQLDQMIADNPPPKDAATGVVKDTPLTRLRELVYGDMINTFNAGRFAETGVVPDKITTPSDSRLAPHIASRLSSASGAYHALGKSMQQLRYQPGVRRAAIRGSLSGLAATIASAAAQYTTNIGPGVSFSKE